MRDAEDMDDRFMPITTPGELDDVFARSDGRAVVVFKHDPYCSISSYAYAELLKLDGEIAWIDVANDQALSFAFAERTGVEHESPQVVVLHHSRPIWAGSHWSIKSDAIRAAQAAPTS